MKTLTALLIIIIALQLSSCQKDNNNLTTHKAVTNASLLGNWKLAGNYISSGGPQYYVAATSYANASFNPDGSLTGTSFPAYNKYSLIDSTTIKLSSTGTDYENFFYKINVDTLRMSPIAPSICIEGCAIVFVK